jgi:hypothetical protein
MYFATKILWSPILAQTHAGLMGCRSVTQVMVYRAAHLHWTDEIEKACFQFESGYKMYRISTIDDIKPKLRIDNGSGFSAAKKPPLSHATIHH